MNVISELSPPNAFERDNGLFSIALVGVDVAAVPNVQRCGPDETDAEPLPSIAILANGTSMEYLIECNSCMTTFETFLNESFRLDPAK